MQKPVWRVASGKLPYGVNDVAYIYRGEVYKGWVANGWLCVQNWYHAGRVSGAFYNTNRTKADKYERVECIMCRSTGKAKLIGTFGDGSEVDCSLCKGKGYRLEAIK